MLVARLYGTFHLSRRVVLGGTRDLFVSCRRGSSAICRGEDRMEFRDAVYKKWSDAAKDVEFKDRPNDRSYVATAVELSALQEKLGYASWVVILLTLRYFPLFDSSMPPLSPHHSRTFPLLQVHLSKSIFIVIGSSTPFGCRARQYIACMVGRCCTATYSYRTISSDRGTCWGQKAHGST